MDEYEYICNALGVKPKLTLAGSRVVTGAWQAGGRFLIVADGDGYEVKGWFRLWVRW